MWNDCLWKRRRETLTCWKLFTVLPMLRPTSGNFLGPKTRAATPAITTSSGIPNPKMALQVRPLFLLLPPLTLTALTLPPPEFNNLGFPKHKDEEEPNPIAAFGIELENETQLIILISISSLSLSLPLLPLWLRFFRYYWN